MSFPKNFATTAIFRQKNRARTLRLIWGIRCLAVVFWLIPVLLCAVPTTWYVDATVSGTNGSGSSSSPCKTIGAAIAKSGTCDTIIVRSGTYAESVSLKSGAPGSPYTLKADTGARVIVTGFIPLPPGNWVQSGTNASGTIWTQTMSGVPRDLFLGNVKQPIARIPAPSQTWLPVQSVDASGTVITLSSSLGTTITNPGSAFVYAFNAKHDAYFPYPISQASGSAITLSGSANPSIAVGDTLILTNHTACLQAPGDWAYTALSSTSTQFYYATAGTALPPANLFTRTINLDGITIQNQSYVTVSGIESSGFSGGHGIYVRGGQATKR